MGQMMAPMGKMMDPMKDMMDEAGRQAPSGTLTPAPYPYPPMPGYGRPPQAPARPPARAPQ
jgi:hypothetical protein